MTLIADYIQQNPQVWSYMEKRVYLIILALLETLFVHELVFLQYVVCNRTCAFTRRLFYIAINKMHLVWRWKSFGKNYISLNILCYCYFKGLLIVLSTTLNPNVLKYIRKSLNICDFVCLYKRLINCPNII